MSDKMSVAMLCHLAALADVPQEDTDTTTLVAVYGFRRDTMKALQKRRLIDFKLVVHPADELFNGQKKWAETVAFLTDAGAAIAADVNASEPVQ